MLQQGPVTKIYELKVIGFDSAEVEFNKMGIELAKLKKQKQDLDKVLSNTVDSGKVADLTKKQQEQAVAVMTLTQKLKEKGSELKSLEAANKTEADGTGRAIAAYHELIKAYKEAKENSEAMEAQFGSESIEAKEAAKAFVLYESELIKINNLRKGNIATNKVAVTTPDPEIPFTHNLNADGTVIQPGITEATLAVNELNKSEAELTNTATAMGQAQLKATDEVKASAPTFIAIKGTLDQYTGTLRENIRAQI